MAGGGEMLRVFFFPFVSPGHMIPLLDMATLFSHHHGVSATIITTPANAPLVRPTISRSSSISLLLLPFPSSVHHLLPDGHENLTSIPSSQFANLYAATFSLHDPLLHLLRLHRPHCLISDSIYHWTADLAAQLSVPHLVFHGPGIFALCVQDSLEIHFPHKNLSDDSDSFVVEGLPHRIELTRSQIPETFQYPSILNMRREAEKKSYGVIVNSFFELEPEYGDLYRNELGRKAWYVGPVSLCNRTDTDMAGRGGGDFNADDCWWLKWLNSKPAGSVLYVCFGTLSEFSVDQLREIAAGLDGYGRPFIWVVRSGGEWLPEVEEFRKGVEGRGVVITGWAPQVLILNHVAVGGFMTHCGWNSTVEAVAAEVPMVTLPLFYEQFINEKLVTEVLGIGVKVRKGGGRVNVTLGIEGEKVGREEIGRAVERVMGGGEEAEGMRRRVREYGEKARAAVEEGGSSYVDLSCLIAELVASQAEAGRGGK